MAVYSNPATSFVAGFLGDPPRTLLDVELAEAGGSAVARINATELALPDNLKAAADAAKSRRAILALPSRAFTVVEDGESGAVMEGTVRAHEMIAGAQRIVLEVSGQRVNLQRSSTEHVVNGDRIRVRTDALEGMLFDAATGLRLRGD